MKAIVVKTVPPTDTRPTRQRAIAEGVPSLTVSRNNAENPRRAAAQALCDRYDWSGELIEGALPNGDAVFVFAPEQVNREGLTYREWLAAAAVERSEAMAYAWSGGEDPTEYRAAKAQVSK